MNRTSRRFTASKWVERLVPVLLAVLLLALIVSLGIVALSMLGLFPGG
jgi:hypothetical protein